MHASASSLPASTAPPVRGWPVWVLDTILVILFLGPLASPLFRATGVPLMADTGLLARDLLATYICPTPAHSYMIAGYPMGVCARCWGATIGLGLARLALRWRTEPGVLGQFLASFRELPWLVRLVLCAAPFGLWVLEIVGTGQSWWVLPLWFLLLNGAQAGAAAGLFFYSVWPAFWARPSHTS